MKMNKYQKLYNELILKLNDESFKHASDISDLLKIQEKNKDLINNKIGQILLKHNIDNGIMSLSKNEINKIYSELSKEINKIFNDEIKTETESVRQKLATIGAEKYDLNDYVYSMGVNYKLTQIPVKKLSNVIDKKVDNKTWSSRIWTNKTNTGKLLKSEIKDFLTGKTNVNDINRVITNRFNVNKFNTKRLVRTEICRVQTAVNNIWCEEHNIKHVMFMATLDSKTSAICQSYDGKVFEMNERNIPEPPLHPNCRSCLVNMVDKDWKPQKRIDNETKENINYESFKDWQEEKAAAINNEIIKDNSSSKLTDVINGLRDLNVTEYTNRRQLGKDILNTLDLNDIPVSVKKIKDYGYCMVTDYNKVISYTLNSNDPRSQEYQIKTNLHEAFHAKANKMDSDRLYIKKEWTKVEETFAESSAHYMSKALGIDKELSPSYSENLVDMLPRLKQQEKFKDCKTIADFGKIAWQDRLNGVQPKWAELYDKCMSAKIDKKTYYKEYIDYVNKNKEELVNKMIENMPTCKDYKKDMVRDVAGAIENINYNNSLSHNQKIVFNNALAITMNRLGVK